MKKTLLFSTVLALVIASAGAAAPFFNESVSSTPVQISAVPCALVRYKIVNLDKTNPIFVHVYDSLSVNVVVGSTSQVDVIPVPAGGAAVFNANGTAVDSFSAGLTIAITTSPVSIDATPPTTAAVVLMVTR